MALTALTIWEVQGTVGNDVNGGGYDTTVAGGTDYSQQGTPRVVIDGSTITATVHTTTTQLNVVGYTVQNPGDVGNIVNISGGTATAGRYRITAADAANNRWTLDRAAGTAAQTATGRMGGCLATIQQGITLNSISGQITYVKADATYQITASLTTPNANIYLSKIVGYTTTRTDGGRATIATGTANPACNGITGTNYGPRFENLIIDGAATTGLKGLIGVSCTGGITTCVNLLIQNFTNEGVKSTSGQGPPLIGCEITACAGATAAVDSALTQLISNCYIHDNTKSGVFLNGYGNAVVDSIIANNSGASSDGIIISGVALFRGCLFYGNGRDGLRFNASLAIHITVINCLMAKNTGAGFNSVLGTAASALVDYNGFWSNTGGATAGTLAIGSHNVSISGTDPTNDPFVDKANKDWRLNATAGAGALLRAAGFPGALPGLATPVGKADIGPYQHADPAGGGGTVRLVI